jgi:hypothetical protein
MLQKLAGRVNTFVDRRGFVGMTLRSAAALAAALFVSPATADACMCGSCCNLCNPSTSCTAQYVCSWAWPCCFECHDDMGMHYENYSCREYYLTFLGGACSGNCQASCSNSSYTGAQSCP